MARTAAALVIGNEILTGKVQEENVAFLGKALFGMGIHLGRVVVCPDHVPTIVDDVRALAARHDVVFTSGGVGPTHDDVTLRGVAQAFGRPIVRAPELEALIRGYFGDRTRDEHLRMADVPDGAELVRTEAMPWPTVCLERVYVLPGVPELFRRKFDAVRAHIGATPGFVSRAIYTTKDEFEIAALLELVATETPDVAIGSYPAYREVEFKVKLTFDGADSSRVEGAFERVAAALGREAIVRTA